MHFDRIVIAGVLAGGFCKSFNRLRKFFPLVEDHAAQPLNAGRFRTLRGKLIELCKSRIKMAL